MDDLQDSQNILLNIGALICKRYEIVRLLGNGGMGSVMQVMDRFLDNEVLAMKILFPHLSRDEMTFARFKNEISVARRLGHPNIVQLFEFGRAGGGYFYITMEYLSGGNLSDEIYSLKRQNLSFPEVLRILRDMASGIAYAHSQGVVHRDLKPDNILFGDNREVKIADFGLAHTMYFDKGLTTAGETVGTPYYMSPELLSGVEVDGRTDIYALGLIAFEMVVGRRLFMEENYLQLARQHFNEPVPRFATEESGIPMWFEKFVKKCAAKNASERYSTADEIVDLLNKKLIEYGGAKPGRKTPAILSLKKLPQRKAIKSIIRKIWRMLVATVFSVTIIFLSYSSPWIKGQTLAVLQKTFLAKYIHATSKLSVKDLYIAIKLGDIEGLRTLLGAGHDINMQNERGVSLLHYAIESKQEGVVRELLELGANANILDDNETSPLMEAARYLNAVGLEKLIQKGAILEAKDLEAKTPLIYAAESGNVENVKRLLDRGAMLEVKDRSGKTPLIYAVQSGKLKAVENILHSGAEVNAQDFEGKSAIFYAAESLESDMVEALLKFGAKTDIHDKSGKNPAAYSSIKNRKLLKSR